MSSRKEFWNETSKYALLLGIVMSASKLLEQSYAINVSSEPAWWVNLEWYISVALYAAILYMATKKRAAKCDPLLGFSFFKGFNYMVLLSVMASIVVGAAYVIYINSTVGYEAYFEHFFVAASQGQISQTVDMLEESFELVKQMPKQVVLVSMFFATLFQYLIAGAFFGVLLAQFTRVAPNFMIKNDEE